MRRCGNGVPSPVAACLQYGDVDEFGFDAPRLPTRAGDREREREQEQRERLQSRDRKRSDNAMVPGAAIDDRENRTLPTLLAQRMVAYPTLVEDTEDDSDTTAFRRRVKDSIPQLGAFAPSSTSDAKVCFLPGCCCGDPLHCRSRAGEVAAARVASVVADDYGYVMRGPVLWAVAVGRVQLGAAPVLRAGGGGVDAKGVSFQSSLYGIGGVGVHQLPSMRDIKPLGSVSIGAASVVGVGAGAAAAGAGSPSLVPPSTSGGDRAEKTAGECGWSGVPCNSYACVCVLAEDRVCVCPICVYALRDACLLLRWRPYTSRLLPHSHGPSPCPSLHPIGMSRCRVPLLRVQRRPRVVATLGTRPTVWRLRGRTVVAVALKSRYFPTTSCSSRRGTPASHRHTAFRRCRRWHQQGTVRPGSTLRPSRRCPTRRGRKR